MEEISIRELIKINKGGDDLYILLDDLNWYEISGKKLSKKFIYKFADRLDWERLLENKNNNIDQDLIQSIIDKDICILDNLDWSLMTDNCKISEDFVEKYIDRFDLQFIGYSGASMFTEEFLLKHKDDLCWRDISAFVDLSIDFIKNNKDIIVWSEYYKYNKYITLPKIKEINVFTDIHNISLNENIPKIEKQNIINFINR